MKTAMKEHCIDVYK